MPPRRLSNILTTPILSVLSIVLNLNMIMFLHQALLIPWRAKRIHLFLPKRYLLFKDHFKSKRMMNPKRDC
jgi:hypothetical protein